MNNTLTQTKNRVTNRLLIKNGLVYDYKYKINGEKLDILIQGNKIVKIAKNIKTSGVNIIEAGGFYVMPGLVDMHAHLREPGQAEKETIQTGTYSAARGGITTLVAMPNTIPPLDNGGIISDLKKTIEEKAFVEVLISSTMTKNRKGLVPVDFEENIRAGCSCFSDDGSAVQNKDVLTEICTMAKKASALLIEHPETDFLAKDSNGIPLPVSYGKLEKRFGIKGQPAESESLDILRTGTIAGMLGTRIHFTHISTGKSVEAVMFLKKTYPHLFTCDCTPHHLILNEDDIKSKDDTDKKINPPLRPEKDRKTLEDAVVAGSIDAIATDHAPHTDREKKLGLEKAPFGTIGFETILPSTYTLLVKSGRITMPDWIKLISFNPAGILGIERGILKEGGSADITIFDPDEAIIVRKGNISSKGKNSAFIDKKFSGSVKYTICKGILVYVAE